MFKYKLLVLQEMSLYKAVMHSVARHPDLPNWIFLLFIALWLWKGWNWVGYTFFIG